MIRRRPTLAGRLLCAPTRAVHAVGAYLHLVAFGDDDALAAHLDGTSPRDLLRAAMPCADPRLYKLLDRLGSSVWSKATYERLAAIAAGPFFEVLLAVNRPIDPPFLNRIGRLGEADEVLRRLPRTLLADQSATEALIAVIALLRAHRLDVDEALASLPKGARLDAVVRRLMRLLGTLNAPSLPRPLPPGLRQIGTVNSMREVGRSLDLCVKAAPHGGADHWMRLVTGASIYVVVDDPVMLAELRRVGPDLWTFGDAKRVGNRQPLPSTKRILTTSLAAAGWKLIDTDPINALVALASRTVADFARWDRDLGQVLRELEDERA